jgi:hypothetical protein
MSADQTLQGLIAGGQLADRVSSQGLSRDILNADIATDRSRLGLDALIAEADAARSSADAGLSRMIAGTGAAAQADASQLGRLQAGTDAAYRSSATNLDALRAGTEASTARDDIDLRRDALSGNLALNAQTAEERRLQQYYDNMFRPFETLSGLAGDVYGGMFDNDAALLAAAHGVNLSGAVNTQNTVDSNQEEFMESFTNYMRMLNGAPPAPTPAGAGG